MKDQLESLFNHAIEQLKSDAILPVDHPVQLMFERTRQKDHGDFATNIAMSLAKPAKRNPRELAELIVAALPSDPLITKLEIAGPGFINLFLAADARSSVLKSVADQGDLYGLGKPNSKQKILVEFVSANPTGPLHVGHGRGAAYGDALARVLAAAGNKVEREYYVNDAGRQMDILAVSVWIRYCQANKIDIELPENGYKGDYIETMGAELSREHGDKYVIPAADVIAVRGKLESEQALDATIELAKDKLGTQGYAVFFELALNTILDDIRQDLQEFGVDYDTWFSERSLFDNSKIDKVVEKLKGSKDIYEKGGALWFKTTDYGDEKDRVVVRENGQPTYFASDIAYHYDKLERGFDLAINVWGSDHHGYIPRVKASLTALGLDPEKLKVLLVQFAVLYQNGKKMAMTTRGGKFVTLRDLRKEIGSDAARFFYAQRKSEQHMDFDLDLAKSQSNDNPMYYVQYAHARICRVFVKAAELGFETSKLNAADLSHLVSDTEVALMTLLQRFPEVITTAAANYEPHQVTYYLRDLATAFNSYYNNAPKILEQDESKRDAMLALCDGTRQVLKNGLTVIGVGAPQSM